MAGAGGAAAPLTGTFVGAPLFDVQKVATARGELFHINALLRSCGHANPARFARLHADAADVLTVLVGKVQYVCVTRAGLEKVLYKVLEFVEGLENAQALADQLGFEQGGEGEEDEEAAAFVPPDDPDMPDLVDDDGGSDDDDDDEEEEAGAGGGGGAPPPAPRAPRAGFDDRRPPPPPRKPQLTVVLNWLGYALRKARRAVMTATKVAEDEHVIMVDAKRKMLSTRQFWLVVEKAVPARLVTAKTKTQDSMVVPPEGGFLLQLFRTLTGQVDAEDELHVMNVARVQLETIFRQLGRKHTGTLMDLALYLLSHGASQAAVEMMATAAGGVHYSTASAALSEAAKLQQTKIRDDLHTLGEWRVVMNFIDNYFFRVRHALRAKSVVYIAAG